MSRRSPLRPVALVWLVVVGWLGTAACYGLLARPERPPNVVLIVADDLGYGDLGVHGSTTGATPRIDALADEGVLFDQAYATGATCSPSRAALLTGVYQQRFGLEFNVGPPGEAHQGRWGLTPESTTVAERLRAAGYATAIVGKWHLGSQLVFHPLLNGFDEFFGFLSGWHSYHPVDPGSQPRHFALQSAGHAIVEADYLTDAFARESVAFIDAHREEPFFLFVSFNAPHYPYEDPPQRYLDRFPAAESDAERTYLAMLSALDDAVAEVVHAIDRNGLTQDTLVVFTSDHGTRYPVSTNEPLRLGKLFLFEGGIRVPMIWRWPGVATPGGGFDSPVSLMDVAATAVAAAGAGEEELAELDGVDLAPHLRGESALEPHPKLYWLNGSNFAVRSGRWKLVQAGEHPWLFDLDVDVGELQNLADDRPDVVDALRVDFEAWAEPLPDAVWQSQRGRPDAYVDGFPYELYP